MPISQLNLSKRIVTVLLAGGLDTVEAVQAAGREGLIALDGIGPVTASEILAAVAETETAAQVETETDERAWVRVQNDSDAPVLVGHAWLFPGDVRRVRRYQLRPGLVVV